MGKEKNAKTSADGDPFFEVLRWGIDICFGRALAHVISVYV